MITLQRHMEHILIKEKITKRKLSTILRKKSTNVQVFTRLVLFVKLQRM